MFTLEICANSFASALAAEIGGANRVELCENMAEGGTTPSYGQIRSCVEQLKIEVWPIIRPRGGDFHYNDNEFEVMKKDVELCKSLGVNGIVTGILTSDGKIDTVRSKILIELAHPIPVAYHRAFDMCNGLEEALETLIELGIVRVLTSGAAENALSGANQIAKLVEQADGRIEVMPGAGIDPSNILAIKNLTNAKTFHTSARRQVTSKMTYRNPNSKMGTSKDEYVYEQTAENTVHQLVNKLKNT